ncbi:EF-hand domain-containing protein [Burkholderia lata]|uniref:EF-hand domain-containing protein n=1 Tax=Burkholderia lata (strain ATCC 17760 / DSM 23089 / LMG 22485 / NCIMB 9086 / R18194 / 383) TaxID=482957 RepID=A0A6P2TJS3_BURL3|nr:EF-hand domain-containing protein [Burkholderia lata]VWC62289.1 hypothetical protein BLA18109_01764 [Burkholderia lata]
MKMLRLWSSATILGALPLVSHAHAMIDSLAGETPAAFVKVGEHMRAPPPDPAGTATAQPTGAALQAQVHDRLKRRFDAAADPSTHLLSAERATAVGWGYVVDHFKEIDPSGKGSISYDDFERFLRAKKGPAFNQS